MVHRNTVVHEMFDQLTPRNEIQLQAGGLSDVPPSRNLDLPNQLQQVTTSQADGTPSPPPAVAGDSQTGGERTLVPYTPVQINATEPSSLPEAAGAQVRSSATDLSN